MLKNRYSGNMTNLNTIESNIKAVQAAYSKLDISKLTQAELDQLVEDSKEIYEWAVVLRYKAYEEKVFGNEKPVQTVQIEVPTINIPLEPTPEVKEESLSSMTAAPSTNEQAPFDFSMFEETEENKEEEKKELTEEKAAIDSSIQEPKQEEVEEDKEDVNKTDDLSAPTPITLEEEIEKIALENISAPLVEEEKTKEEPKVDSEFHLNASEEVKTPEIKHTIDEVPYTSVVEGGNKLISKFSKADSSFSSQIGMTKLSTLIGAFGLNERLQYINELFDGSSEAFAEAIKTIDSQTSFDEALAKTSIFADQYHWDIESDTVEELVTKIRRRYA